MIKNIFNGVLQISLLIGILLLVGVIINNEKANTVVNNALNVLPVSSSEVYLPDTIQRASVHMGLVNLLRNAKEGDEITIHLNGYGGYVNAGLLIINAIEDSKATVTMQVDGPVYSMHALLACAGDKTVVKRHGYLMFHHYIPGRTLYDDKNTRIGHDATEQMSIDLMNKTCVAKGILTKKEVIDIMTHNIDTYIQAEEATTRMERAK